MSYIIKNSEPFVSLKLTQKGREQLAKGALNFSFWGIGDSEINYNREEVFDGSLDTTYTAKILRPVDDQPNIKYFIKKVNTSEPLNIISGIDLKTIKLVVSNQAKTRGFFDGNHRDGFTNKITPEFSISRGVIPSTNFIGGVKLDIGTTGLSNGIFIGDSISFKFTNEKYPSEILAGTTNALTVINYEVIGINGTIITLNRVLPILDFVGDINYFVYPGLEIYDSGLWGGNTLSYWNGETLSFDSSCDVSRSDVPVLNFNIVNLEDIAGYFSHLTYDSYNYLGQMENYFSYNDVLSNPILTNIDKCADNLGLGYIDSFKKMLGVIHYTNNTISNFYGDFFHIDIQNNKNLVLSLPTMMYHRKTAIGGTSKGVSMGMTFIGSGESKVILGSEIIYYDLIEDPTYVSGKTPRVVGKILPQLKMVLIDDEEILFAMSQHTNRNWTLPTLKGRLINSNNGVHGGMLQSNKKIYLTYRLKDSLTPQSIHCAKYLVIENNSETSKDVEFSIEDINNLPYMKNASASDYNGLGFTSDSFDIIYQITGMDSRPINNGWKKFSFNDSIMGSGTTINPLLLENQNPIFNNQIINSSVVVKSIIYNYATEVGQSVETKKIGSEKFLYGNLETYIGATIYKTIFDLRINSSEFIETSNPTRSVEPLTNPPIIRVSEAGIYDSNKNLVMIGKFDQPIKLEGGTTITLELSMDF